ncbi:MAG: T9SS type A sorting domain-containing protein [Bacteroidetes bacterium]|nr:T9SS type A sorting domain-containing protein [Bacteroidota bacterium]
MFSVYLNPSNGGFTISTDSDMNLSIINNLGQVVKEISINSSNNYNASVSNLANGIYFVVGKNNDQLIKTKIIVSK